MSFCVELHNRITLLRSRSSIMDLLSASMQYAAVGFILVLATAFFFKPTGLVKWVQKKNYQYEVTFALYMMTPTEKFIFSTSR